MYTRFHHSTPLRLDSSESRPALLSRGTAATLLIQKKARGLRVVRKTPVLSEPCLARWHVHTWTLAMAPQHPVKIAMKCTIASYCKQGRCPATYPGTQLFFFRPPATPTGARICTKVSVSVCPSWYSTQCWGASFQK